MVQPCHHRLCLLRTCASLSAGTLYPRNSKAASCPPLSSHCRSTSCLYEFDYSGCFMEVHLYSISLCVWRISLSRMSSGFIQVVACIGILFLFEAEFYSIVQYTPPFVYPLPVCRHLGCWHFLVIRNAAAMNISVQVSLSPCFPSCLVWIPK